MENTLRKTFGHRFGPKLMAQVLATGKEVHLPAGQMLVDIGNYIRFMPLVLSGAIKVLREDEEGYELLLYYLEAGETCSMTMACCMGNTKSEIRAITETEVHLVQLPVENMEAWMDAFASWRNFVFENHHKRFNNLLDTVDTIAFKNMDQRLVAYLKKRSELGKTTLVQSTHQQIANDLHTSRVVVSRLLKKLESMGKVALQRNQIQILNL